MDRTERQKLCLTNWVKSNCRGVIQACTGFGKSRTGLMAIKLWRLKNPNLSTIIVVPTKLLKDQWEKQVVDIPNVSVQVINSAIKINQQCDLLIIDEIHRTPADSFRQIFTNCKFNYILGLTATLERLDGKHEILKEICPICDTISVDEALENDWVSPYKEYLVLIEPDDIATYNALNSEFQEHFEFFNWNFSLAMACVGPKGFATRNALRQQMCANNPKLNPKAVYNAITYHATGLMRTMQGRKKYVNEHPKKIELARKIVQFRPFSKIITFSATIEVAKNLAIGNVYTGKQSDKKSKDLLDKFNSESKGVLSTVKRADEGLDVKGLNCAIILGQDSSPTRLTQRLGRVIRYEEGKTAEVFTLAIADTVELSWFRKSHEGKEYITIDADNLMNVLCGKPYDEYKKHINQTMFRF